MHCSSGPSVTNAERYSSANKSFLCFAGRLRLSTITRVAPAFSPDLRATRRASLPLSNTFARRFFISTRFRRVAQSVRHCPGSVVAAAQTRLCRRVVRRTTCGERRARRAKRIGPHTFRRSDGSADGRRETIQKIAARDAAMHPQFAVTRGITHYFLLDIFPSTHIALRALDSCWKELSPTEANYKHKEKAGGAEPTN
jgi:hypothetical protein